KVCVVCVVMFLLTEGTEWSGPEHLDDIAPDINACVYSERQWEALIEAHDILTLICLYLPEKHIWKEARPDWRLDFLRWGLSLKKLLRGVMKERNKTWDKAKKKWHKVMKMDRRESKEAAGAALRFACRRDAKMKVAKKNVVPGMRYLLFGL